MSRWPSQCHKSRYCHSNISISHLYFQNFHSTSNQQNDGKGVRVICRLEKSDKLANRRVFGLLLSSIGQLLVYLLLQSAVNTRLDFLCSRMLICRVGILEKAVLSHYLNRLQGCGGYNWRLGCDHRHGWLVI